MWHFRRCRASAPGTVLFLFRLSGSVSFIALVGRRKHNRTAAPRTSCRCAGPAGWSLQSLLAVGALEPKHLATAALVAAGPRDSQGILAIKAPSPLPGFAVGHLIPMTTRRALEVNGHCLGSWQVVGGFCKKNGAPNTRPLQRPPPRGSTEQHPARRPLRGVVQGSCSCTSRAEAQVGGFSGSRACHATSCGRSHLPLRNPLVLAPWFEDPGERLRRQTLDVPLYSRRERAARCHRGLLWTRRAKGQDCR